MAEVQDDEQWLYGDENAEKEAVKETSVDNDSSEPQQNGGCQ